jgi:cytosine/adenosine deaminase-related metal-dependent hydrolase
MVFFDLLQRGNIGKSSTCFAHMVHNFPEERKREEGLQ